MDAQLLAWDVRPFLAEGATRCQQSFAGARHGAEKVLLKCNWSAVGADSSEQVSCGSSDRSVNHSVLACVASFLSDTSFLSSPLVRIVHIWDAATAEQLYYLPGHKGSVNQVPNQLDDPSQCRADCDELL
jgi:Prp8 binding protein